MMTPRSFLFARQHLSRPPPSSTTPSSTTPSSTSRDQNSFLPTPRKDDRTAKNIISPSPRPSNTTVASRPGDLMGKRKESSNLSTPGRSPTNTTMMSTVVAQSDTPASAVQIPIKQKLEAPYTHKSRRCLAEAQRRNSDASSRRKEKHDPDAIPPSVAALLAITSIPPQSRRGSSRLRRQSKDPRMTVDSIVPRSQVSEKELSQELSLTSLGRSPLDLLLTPPEDLLDREEEASVTSDSAFTSALSTRDGSYESLPSLGDSYGTSTLPSVDSPITPRTRTFRPPRRSLEPVFSPPGEQPEHPLYIDPKADADQVEFKVFDPLAAPTEQQQSTVFMPFKSAFKSNLTASLRALRSAAKSLSTFTASSIPAEDLLTRSILTADPAVPFTDERRPPVLEDEPSEALRRYLNPTSSARLDLRTGGATSTRSYTASIQMQTYKVQKSRSACPAATRAATPQPPSSPKVPAALAYPPGPRQREIRENSDFIRIAVMEHLMRKSGKLDDSREGHARWLLPPRKSTSKAYSIGADGVPVRWVPIPQEFI